MHDIKDKYDAMLHEIELNLMNKGYSRQGSVFRLFSQESCGIIEFQKSTKSTKKHIIFTVNISVVYKKFIGSEISEKAYKKVKSVDAHLRERIGFLLPERCDKWWTLDYSTSVDKTTKMISKLLEEYVVPYIQKYLSLDDVIVLWESGQSPGLTNYQRVQFLNRLKDQCREI